MESLLVQTFLLSQASLDSILLQPTDPSRRLFWGFLLSAFALGIVAILWQERSQGARPWRVLLTRVYWCQTSHLVDLALLFFNTAIRIGLLIPMLGSHLIATIWVARWWQGSLGNAPPIELPLWLIAGFFTLTFFVLEDHSRFTLHRAMHSHSLLWRLHRIHHGAVQLSPLTLHRVHPLEMALYYLRGLIIFGLVGGTFAYWFGQQLSALEILGVDALGFLFNAAGANLRHSPIWLGFGRLERWFVSPAQHQIHHSSEPADCGSNYGTCLACWDRIWGSWRASGKIRDIRFGLPSDTPHAALVLVTAETITAETFSTH